jgi:ABC-type transport system involved in cytochrome c biogenesis permease subunit
MALEHITIFCFAASYTVALCLELFRLFKPRELLRLSATLFAAAGLLAHTLFLAVHRPALASQFGSLLFLAWVLAVFHLYGSLHHRRVAWGVFVLPVVLGLTIISGVYGKTGLLPAEQETLSSFDSEPFWRLFHVALFILAAVGVCVAFVASVMYLIQAQRLKTKALPGEGIRLLSLERLEEMNRRAINLAFPLLTAGLLIGMARMLQERKSLGEWTDPRILGTILLWIVIVIVLFLRYSLHLRGRNLSLLTIVAFALLVLTLVTAHGGVP